LARNQGFFAPFDRLRAGCGSKEEPISFVRSGGIAARTNEKDRYFLAAAGEKN
jgi:hypothetical protein